MCKNPTINAANPRTTNTLLLTSLNSFGEDAKGQTPSTSAKLFTIGAFILFLVMMEQLCRLILLKYSDFHPLLEDETNRFILARHLGIDLVSAVCVSYFGFKGRYITQDMYDTVIHGKKNAMAQAYDNRLFKYHPEAARVIVLFLGYQIKNSYDTMVWNDGALFIAHHILAFFTAWGALFPGASHYYAPFYLGYSEFSTATLCLLANFDDEFGIKGLGDAFPLTKVILGVAFTISFIVFRVIIWSTMSYFYLKDIIACFKANDPRLVGRRTWFQFTGFSLSLLSLLQIIWLGEIFSTGKQELQKLGFL